ncbi:MAG: hypothetical protein GEV11_12225 [Streptosporangiales bacterium]|nr:hypothetical protein [Streptosporangiales bacterium]
MTGHIVVADVFRLERALVLDRSPASPDGRPPAVLVIPRGGGPRDPYLVVLDHRGESVRHLSAGLDFVDYHVVADAGRTPDRGWCDVADVLACAGDPSRRGAAGRIAALLDRYPGSEVVTCGGPSGHLVGTRGGHLIRITAVAAGLTADPVAPLGGYGSVVHAWLAAGLPLECLEKALVVAGHYVAPERRRPGRLVVAVRDHVHSEPFRDRRSRPAA